MLKVQISTRSYDVYEENAIELTNGIIIGSIVQVNLTVRTDAKWAVDFVGSILPKFLQCHLSSEFGHYLSPYLPLLKEHTMLSFNYSSALHEHEAVNTFLRNHESIESLYFTDVLTCDSIRLILDGVVVKRLELDVFDSCQTRTINFIQSGGEYCYVEELFLSKHTMMPHFRTVNKPLPLLMYYGPQLPPDVFRLLPSLRGYHTNSWGLTYDIKDMDLVQLDSFHSHSPEKMKRWYTIQKKRVFLILMCTHYNKRVKVLTRDLLRVTYSFLF
jgi:hypothetical protein